jgi:hypothetical protein
MAQELDNDKEIRDDNNEIGDNDFQTVGIKDLHSDVIQQVSGTVAELVKNGFILQDSTGKILVDTPGQLNLTSGEQVTVIGEFYNSEEQSVFDGLIVTKANGTVALNPFFSGGARTEDDILDGNGCCYS